MNNQQGYNSGVLIACAQNKLAPSECIRIMEKHATLQEDPVVIDELLKMGAAIMREGGYEEDAQMYELMRGTPIQSKFARAVYVDSVLETLGAAAYDEAKQYQVKQANPIIGGAAKLVGMTPEALQMAAIVSLAAGMGLGGGYWALNRDSNTVDDETAVKEEQAKYYKSLAKDLRRRMRDKGVKQTKTPEVVNKPTSDILPSADTMDTESVYA